MSDSALRRAMIAIAALTVATGAAQVLAPRRVLSPLAAQDDATTGHLFGTVGMFMVVVGGGLLNTLRAPGAQPRGRLLRRVAEDRSLDRCGARRPAPDLLPAGAPRRRVRPPLRRARVRLLATVAAVIAVRSFRP